MIESKEQFKEFRVNNGYTQKEFAAALGFSEDYISAIERGTRPLTDERYYRQRQGKRHFKRNDNRLLHYKNFDRV